MQFVKILFIKNAIPVGLFCHPQSLTEILPMFAFIHHRSECADWKATQCTLSCNSKDSLAAHSYQDSHTAVAPLYLTFWAPTKWPPSPLLWGQLKRVSLWLLWKEIFFMVMVCRRISCFEMHYCGSRWSWPWSVVSCSWIHYQYLLCSNLPWLSGCFGETPGLEISAYKPFLFMYLVSCQLFFYK